MADGDNSYADANPQITIAADGTLSPPYIVVNNGGVVKFEVSAYPPGMNQCILTVSVSWDHVAAPPDAPPGTIKVGS